MRLRPDGLAVQPFLLIAALATACGGDPPSSTPIDGGRESSAEPDAGSPDARDPVDVSVDAIDDGARPPIDADAAGADTKRGDADASRADTVIADSAVNDLPSIDGPSLDTPRTDAPFDRGNASDVGSGEGGPPPIGQWFKGDLHVHSLHSTDAMDSPVVEEIAKAEQLGLDYFVITDHDNHVNGNIETWSDPDYRSSKMVLLYGAEWTTGKGHANIFGTRPYDYAPIWAARDGDGAVSIAGAHAQGLHFSVNHPAAKDLWEWGFDLDFDSMEVWTAPFVLPDANPTAITKWDELLLAGRRLAVRGGSDSHHQHDLESTLFNIGNPTTWIYATERTGEAVLAGLKAGHVSISYAPTAERVDLTADVDGDGTFETIVGDNVPQMNGRSIRLKVEIVGLRSTSTYNVTLFKNGVSFKTWQLTSPTVTLDDTPSATERTYYRVEVRGPTSDAPIISSVAFGDFIALTNPIFVGFP